MNKTTKIAPSKKNPLLVQATKKDVPKAEYKSVRIHPEDFEYLREYAFKNKTTIVDAVSLAVEALKK